MDQGLKFEPLGRGFKIAVSKHHTFGTDAVLLSHFAMATAKDRAVDLGTGCGIIPLLMLRDKKINIYGVDISAEAIDLCEISKAENQAETFFPVNADLKELKGKVPFGANTLVTCNPPYKAEGAGLTNPDKTVRTARHETECTMSDIVFVGAKLLQTGGRLCMCQRPERAAELICLMHENKVEPKRMRFVSKCVGEKPWLVLVEGRRSGKVGLIVEPELYLYDNKGNLTAEMIEIYGEYKKNFL